MKRRSDKNAYTDPVSQEDNYYTRMLLLELFIQAQLNIFPLSTHYLQRPKQIYSTTYVPVSRERLISMLQHTEHV